MIPKPKRQGWPDAIVAQITEERASGDWIASRKAEMKGCSVGGCGANLKLRRGYCSKHC